MHGPLSPEIIYFCASNCPTSMGPISLLSGQRNTWHYQQHFVQMLIETKHLHKWSKENCCKSNDSEYIFFKLLISLLSSHFCYYLLTLHLLPKEI